MLDVCRTGKATLVCASESHGETTRAGLKIGPNHSLQMCRHMASGLGIHVSCYNISLGILFG
jgi:hypothetical protein